MYPYYILMHYDQAQRCEVRVAAGVTSSVICIALCFLVSLYKEASQ